MKIYQGLVELGLLRIRRTDDGTFWWVGRKTAEELVSLGKAEPVPLSAEQLKERDGYQTGNLGTAK